MSTEGITRMTEKANLLVERAEAMQEAAESIEHVVDNLNGKYQSDDERRTELNNDRIFGNKDYNDAARRFSHLGLYDGARNLIGLLGGSGNDILCQRVCEFIANGRHLQYFRDQGAYSDIHSILRTNTFGHKLLDRTMGEVEYHKLLNGELPFAEFEGRELYLDIANGKKREELVDPRHMRFI